MASIETTEVAPTLNKRQIQKAATKKRILQTTRRLFLDKGLSAVKTSMIAELAGVAEGTIFSHFGDIHRLLSEVNRIETDIYLKKGRESISSSMDLETKVLTYSRILMSCYAESAGTLLRYTIFSTDITKNELDRQVADAIDCMSDIIQEGVDSGELEKETRVKVIAGIWYSILISNIIAGLRVEPFDLEERFDIVKTGTLTVIDQFRVEKKT